MKYITLDFTGCRYLGEIHKVLKEQFEFPDYYGENLSALWDCMSDYCSGDLHVYIKGLSDLPKEFDDYMNKIWKIFCRVNSTTPNITFEIIS